VECDIWDMLKAKDWMGFKGELPVFRLLDEADGKDNPPVPTKIALHKTAGIPTLYTLQVDNGRVYAMYSGSQVQNLRNNVRSLPILTLSILIDG